MTQIILGIEIGGIVLCTSLIVHAWMNYIKWARDQRETDRRMENVRKNIL